VGEQIGYRYMVADILDRGAYGQVVKGIDVKMGGLEVAIKLSRVSRMDIDNSKKEASILYRLKEKDTSDRFGVVKILDAFLFRKHVVIVTELLHSNLYKVLHEDGFKGLRKEDLKQFSSSIL